MKKQQKTLQAEKEKQEQGMWDVLLPLLLVIVVLPFVVHLAAYSCGYAEYDWYADEDVLADFYCYYKGYFFAITGFFAAVILAFRMSLYREKNRTMRIYIPMLFYGFFVIASTVLSVNLKASLQGNFESFESCFVLLSYVVISVYAYQIMEYERDYKFIWYALLGVGILFSIMGLLQAVGIDFMNFDWVQRLIMSETAYGMYGGELEDTFLPGRVYLTLYNSNYAGIVLAMLFVVTLAMSLTESKKKKRADYFIFAAMLFLLVWYTYARAALLSVVVVLCYLAYLQKKSGRWRITGKSAAIVTGIVGGVVCVLVLLDYRADFKYISRILEKNDREPLESLLTKEDGIHITYAKKHYKLWLEGDTLCYQEDTDSEVTKALPGEEMELSLEEGAKAIYLMDTEPVMMLYLADTTLQFVKEGDAYFYKTVAGKLTEMTEVSSVDLHGLEYLGSARGYIWSRVFPLLKKYLFVGSGPDTFPEVFPQQDYTGKIVYSDQPDMVIEKAHNDYLTKWVQTGMLSVLCIGVFYVTLFWQGKKAYEKRERLKSMQSRIGYGCYLACLVYIIASLFNDSTLQTAPLFWVFAGILFSCIKKSKNV